MKKGILYVQLLTSDASMPHSNFNYWENSVSRLFNGGPKPIVSLLTYRAFCPWHQLQHDKVIYEMKLKYR